MFEGIPAGEGQGECVTQSHIVGCFYNRHKDMVDGSVRIPPHLS